MKPTKQSNDQRISLLKDGFFLLMAVLFTLAWYHLLEGKIS